MRLVVTSLFSLVACPSAPTNEDAGEPPDTGDLPTIPPTSTTSSHTSDTGGDDLGAVSLRLPFHAGALAADWVYYLDEVGGEGDPNVREFVVAESDDSRTTRVGTANDDHLVYRTPIFAPVDGEIVTCWAGYPDQPEADDTRITPEGNHLRILTDNGEVVLVGHLAANFSLCPHGGEGYPEDLDQRIGDWPAEYVVQGERPRVQSGNLIGQAGRSGADGPPRVHLEVRRMIGDNRVSDTLPMQFVNGWFHLEGTEWAALQGETLSEVPVWIHASPFRRRGLVTGGTISEVAMAGEVVAYRNASGELEVSAVRNSLGVLDRQEDQTASAADLVHMVRLGATQDVVTAARSAGGSLSLTSWRRSVNGIEQGTSVLGGPVDEIAVSSLPDGSGLFTAVRRPADGTLELRAWEVQPGTLQILPRGNAEAGAIDAVAVAATEAERSAAVTATTDGSGELKLIVWPFDTATGLFDERSDDATGGSIWTGPAMVRAPVDGVDLFVTAAADAALGALKVVVWQVDARGRLQRRGEQTMTVPWVSRFVDIDAGPPGHVVVTTRHSIGGDLELVAFEVTPQGAITAVGRATAGLVWEGSSTYLHQAGRDFVVTAVQSADDTLRVIAFEATLD